MRNQPSPIKEPESRVRVRFQHCDPFGHLNNACYIDYFINAREDHLLEYYDFDVFGWGRRLEESWVVTKSQIAYLVPAQVMEEVIIRSRLIHVTGRSLLVEGLMLDSLSGRLKALCWIEFVYVSLASGRPAHHPAEFMEFANGVRVEGVDPADFDGRLRQVRSEFRGRSHSMAGASAGQR